MMSKFRACFLSLPWSKHRLCSANHRPGYWSNLPCDWPSTAWAYSEPDAENGPRSSLYIPEWHWISTLSQQDEVWTRGGHFADDCFQMHTHGKVLFLGLNNVEWYVHVSMDLKWLRILKNVLELQALWSLSFSLRSMFYWWNNLSSQFKFSTSQTELKNQYTMFFCLCLFI